MKINRFPLLLASAFLLAACANNGDISKSSSSDGFSSEAGSDSNEKTAKYTIVFDLNGGSSASYVSSKTVEALSSSDFFFDCKKAGYNFRGWSYNGIKIFDETGKTLISPTMEATMTFVAVFANDAKMTITTNMEEAGTVKGEGYYEYNTDVSVLAEPNQGYNFLGWYDADGIPLSSQKFYNYRMSESDITIEARFELATFEFNIKSNNDRLGVVCIDPTASTAITDYGGSASKSVVYTNDVKIAANTKTDVRFLGWFDEDSTLVSTNPVYSFTMPNRDYYLEAKWNSFAVNYDTAGGTNSSNNPSSVSTEQEASLSDPYREGYTFKGWYDKTAGEKITNIALGTLNDIDLAARWEAISYSITYELDGGENASGNPDTYTIEDDIVLGNPTKAGYRFDGWFEDASLSTKVSYIPKGSIGDRTFYSKWTAISYTITYELSGGTNSVDNPRVFTVEDNVPLKSPAREGYDFKGWYKDGSFSESIDEIPAGTVGNLTIYAKWEARKQDLAITSSDASKGSVSISGIGHTDETIIATATPACDCLFKGWYKDDVLVSENNPYTFTMPSWSYSLVALFWTESEEKADKERREALGIDPVIDSENGTLTYGLYPQTRVSDDNTITALKSLESPKSNGWYFLNETYYAKKEANPDRASCTFDDGERIVSGREYWYKCEPIKWKILFSSNGKYDLLSELLLDVHRYNKSYDGVEDGHYANNYKESEIREWLNTCFYNTAFSLENSLLTDTIVMNWASTTASNPNQYACEPTNDKVYLLSYETYSSTNHFPDLTSRMCKTTDWARANGANNDSYSKTYNGDYWTRSPGSDFDSCVSLVMIDGRLTSSYAHFSDCCVRPGITIKIA